MYVVCGVVWFFSCNSRCYRHDCNRRNETSWLFKGICCGCDRKRGYTGHLNSPVNCHGRLCIRNRCECRQNVFGRGDTRFTGGYDAYAYNLCHRKNKRITQGGLVRLGRSLCICQRSYLGAVFNRNYPRWNLWRHLYTD